MEVPSFSILLANVEVNNVLDKSVGSGKRGCYVKLSPDIKARFYSSATQTRYPSTITSTHNSLAIMTALSTEAKLHVWCDLAIIKPWKFLTQWPICENFGPQTFLALRVRSNPPFFTRSLPDLWRKHLIWRMYLWKSFSNISIIFKTQSIGSIC